MVRDASIHKMKRFDQDVAKLRSVFRFDAFLKRNETKFETKWPILKFFEKISINFDRFGPRNWCRNFDNDRNFSKLFRKISIVDLKIEKDRNKFFEIYFNPFRSQNDRKRSKFSRDRNKISKNFVSKIFIETKWTISINFATSCF